MQTKIKRNEDIAEEQASVSDSAEKKNSAENQKIQSVRKTTVTPRDNQTDLSGLDSYKAYEKTKNEYESAKSSIPEEYDGGDYSKRLNELADKILNRKAFSYDHSTDDNYLAYLKSYRDSGAQAAKKSLSSMSKMSAGYGNSYAYRGAQTEYERYMSKATDKIPELYSDAYSRYRDEEDSLYDKYKFLSGEESKNYSRYRDSVEDSENKALRAYRDMTDAYDRYYKDRDYNHTLERESIADKRYETEYADKLKQQATENDLNERKFFESVIRGDFEDDLNERKYQSELAQKKIENDLNERKFNDQVAEEVAESYRYERDNRMKERQWQIENKLNKANLEEEKKQNSINNEYKYKSLEYSKENDDRNYELSKRKTDSDEDQWLKEYNEKIREFDENMIYKKYFS